MDRRLTYLQLRRRQSSPPPRAPPRKGFSFAMLCTPIRMPDYDDLRAVAPAVLTHRLVINFAAEAARRSAPDIVEELLHSGRWRQV